MAPVKNFYLSGILDLKISAGGGTLGTLRDLITLSGERPQVKACLVRGAQGRPLFYDWDSFRIERDGSRLRVTCGEPKEIDPPEDSIYLRKHILDKQIVDINGVKVVRVNDVRLASVSDGVFVVAVDVGFEGLLRRLGVVDPVRAVMKLFKKNLSSRFILWSNMQPFVPPLHSIQLSMGHSKLNTLHPSELADIIEDLDVRTRTAIFDALDHDRAADVLEELETDVQVSILHQLPIEKAADVLEKMPADEVADILDDLEAGKAEKLLSEMEQDVSEEVRELMEYPEHTVGSIMSTDFISFKEEMTVNDTILELRRLKPEPDTVYYLYVVDDEERLTATVSLRDLIISEPDVHLREIMNRKVIHALDHDDITSLMEIISKYSLLAIPVVSDEMRMLGIVIIDDVVYELLKPKRRRQ